MLRSLILDFPSGKLCILCTHLGTPALVLYIKFEVAAAAGNVPYVYKVSSPVKQEFFLLLFLDLPQLQLMVSDNSRSWIASSESQDASI